MLLYCVSLCEYIKFVRKNQNCTHYSESACVILCESIKDKSDQIHTLFKCFDMLCNSVSLHISFLCKSFIAKFTFVGLLSSMYSKMPLKVYVSSELFATIKAYVFFSFPPSSLYYCYSLSKVFTISITYSNR